jgi:hypothetical protein
VEIEIGSLQAISISKRSIPCLLFFLVGTEHPIANHAVKLVRNRP